MIDNNSNGTINKIKKYDDKEDFAIKLVAGEKENIFSKYIFCVAIILLGILISTCILIYNEYKNKNNSVIEIKSYKRNVEIINDSRIDEVINNETFKEDKYKVVRISKIRVSGEENSKVMYNVKYSILENDFNRNNYSTVTSDVLVKFSYSYDKDEWTYINNVIRIEDEELKSVLGNNYDIAGIINTLKVSSNNVIELNGIDKDTIYWRSETIFKKPILSINNKFKANFYIEYVEIK